MAYLKGTSKEKVQKYRERMLERVRMKQRKNRNWEKERLVSLFSFTAYQPVQGYFTPAPVILEKAML